MASTAGPNARIDQRGRRSDVAPQHAQRRRARQLQQRRQCEATEHGDRGEEARCPAAPGRAAAGRPSASLAAPPPARPARRSPVIEPRTAAARPDQDELREAHRQREGTRRAERLHAAPRNPGAAARSAAPPWPRRWRTAARRPGSRGSGSVPERSMADLICGAESRRRRATLVRLLVGLRASP